MENKKTVGILILAVIVLGLVAGIVLVKRPQSTTGKAVGRPTPPTSPQIYLKEDFNRNGLIDEQDFIIFKQKFLAKDPAADLDSSGEVNGLDYNLFLSKMK